MVSHPFGNPNCYNLVAGLYAQGRLSAFHTSLFGPLGSRRRWHPSLEGAPIYQHRLPELFRLAMTLSPLSRWNGYAPVFVDWAIGRFDNTVARSVGRHHAAVYCYEDAAQKTFLAAKEAGLPTIYDLPTGYFEAKWSLSREVVRDSSLKPFFPGLNEPQEKLERKRRELTLADVVVCASSFTRQSLAGHLSAKQQVMVVPYGTDLHQASKTWSRADCTGPLRLLFVGLLGPQKGLHHLFEALAGLPPNSFELSLAGRWIGGFREWITQRYSVPFLELGHVPRGRLPEVCRSNHALVFPSLFDGFGLVLLEAMAAGIPVISSTNSGGPDIVHEPEDGMIVPTGDVERLRNAIGWMMENRELLGQMGQRARKNAECFTWQRYRERMAAGLANYAN